MKAIIGKFLIVLGVLMLGGASWLFFSNLQEQQQAAASSEAAIHQVAQVMTQRAEQLYSKDPQPQETEPEETQPQLQTMPVVEIDGYDYIGFLGIPALELELPIMADWSYPQLQIAPCRFSGDLYSDDLVLMAHNYPKHFGRLQTLQPGDAVRFTDMDGRTMHCQVTAVEILEAEAVEEMTAGQAQLTLFTCTYGGQGRIAVRCGPAQGKTGNG